MVTGRAADPAGAGLPVVGAIEAGGTTFVCAVGRTADEVRLGGNRCVVATEPDPDHTWDAVRRFFSARGPLAAIGVGSFGPLDLAAGTIARTPKPGWDGFSWPDRVAEITGAPLALDTDVDAAALAEWRHGAAREARIATYVTVGTGIGGGTVVGGAVLRASRHPELGHLLLARLPGDDFPGSCGSHGHCLEGLASGDALRRRTGVPADELADDHPAWALEVAYLGAGLADVVLALAPDRLVVGGGVLRRRGLLGRIRSSTEAALAGYLDLGPDPGRALEDLIVAPGLGDDAGLVGAFELGAELVRPQPG